MWKEGLTRVRCRKLGGKDKTITARMLVDENTKRVCRHGRFGSTRKVTLTCTSKGVKESRNVDLPSLVRMTSWLLN